MNRLLNNIQQKNCLHSSFLAQIRLSNLVGLLAKSVYFSRSSFLNWFVLYIKVVEFCKLLARLFCKIRFALIIVIHCISG